MGWKTVWSGVVAAAALAGSAAAQPHNVIIFVADGLRAKSVTAEVAPELAAVRSEGVDFTNSHSIYPTVTTANASAIATGHYLGDTGNFGNTIYVGAPLPPPDGTSLAAIEEDPTFALLNDRFEGNYLGETSLLQAARAKGFATVSVGKLGPVGVQDVLAHDGRGTIIIDDETGRRPQDGLPLSPEIAAAIAAAGLELRTPDRGANAFDGDDKTPGTKVANVSQQDWYLAVATKVLLPRFKTQGKPFVMVFWSRDPDGSQHNHGDSLNALEPGINGPTSKAAIANASKDLGALRKALADLGLADTTDVITTADHGFSTMTREAPNSASARYRYPGVVPGFIPPGFLAIDMAQALGLPLHDPEGKAINPAAGGYPKHGALLGADPAHPEIVLAPNGGTELIWLPGPDAKALAARVVEFLTGQDYTAAIFVNDGLGPIPGALPTSAVNLLGSSRTPAPSIAVSFRTSSLGCDEPEMCAIEIADSGQQQGQGIHGSLGRQDTHNFMAAVGPDFRKGFADPTPVSNADWAPTLAHILGLDLGGRGALKGRVMREALASGAPVGSGVFTLRSAPAANGFVTILNGQTADGARYFDAAGAPGRTVGLKP
ncbi:MAG: alkaline phosphatase family protein [Phenylobacterium sp.]|uniref:alkaline phosphatase family protein n=1 Tax=Phenylobacterium sp. TaxID=1871053 RepID=UPI0025F05F8A|nr:alkaline phosphatase family protein [Phenylobacterium sp.]MBI1199753.1 alkaline phosphatase family protein [Phenylobacterium sp.]